MRAGILAAVGLACLVSAAAGYGRDAPQGVTAARIPLYPMQPDNRRAGGLLYRGGLVLSSKDTAFGGWSDLVVSADGERLLAISDAGHWLRAQLAYDANGDLAGIGEAMIAPMLDEDGRALHGADSDAEGLTAVAPNMPDGEVLVSFERHDRIWRYDLARGLDGALPRPVPTGAWVSGLRPNLGLEAITLWRPDTLLALSEFTRDANGDMVAALEDFPGDALPLHTRKLGVVRHPPFEITSVAAAPGGGIFLLERRFSLAGGLGMEIRRVAAADIHEGGRIQGEVIANLNYQDANIDNMEGLNSRVDANGKTLLYVLSDDNYLPFQRTLLLMFEVTN